MSRLPHPDDGDAWLRYVAAPFDQLFNQIAPPKAVETLPPLVVPLSDDEE